MTQHIATIAAEFFFVENFNADLITRQLKLKGFIFTRDKNPITMAGQVFQELNADGSVTFIQQLMLQ